MRIHIARPSVIGPLLALLVLGAVQAATPAYAAPRLQPSGWPSSFSLLDTDSNDCGGSNSDHRDVMSAHGAIESGYLFLRFDNVGSAGWPSTGPQGEARYKWFIDTVDGDVHQQGGNIIDAEYLLQVEDLTLNASDPTPGRDQLGEMTLMDDLASPHIGFSTRWNSTNPPKYTTNTPSGVPSPSPHWRRVLGTGTVGTGGPQGSMTDPDIGYRVTGDFIDMYVSLAALGNPVDIEVMWATDAHSNNLDSGPNCDRSDNVTEGVPIPEGSGTLIVRKEVTPNGDLADFDFTVTGPLTDELFTLSDGQNETLLNLAAGTFTITETLPTGWVLDNVSCQRQCPDQECPGIDEVQIGNGVQVQIFANEILDCTVFNRDTYGTLRIEKTTDPPAALQDFDFDVSGNAGSVAQFAIGHGEIEELRVPAGDYTITESVPPGWSYLIGLCDDETIGNNPIEPTVQPGGFTNCTIFNQDVQAELTIRKETTPDGSAQAFDFEVEGPPASGPSPLASFNLSDGESETILLPAGVYTATEMLPAGWELDDLSCTAGCRDNQECDIFSFTADELTDGVALNLPPASAVECTFRNQQDTADLWINIEPLKGDQQRGGGNDIDDDPAAMDADELLAAAQPPNTAWAGEEIVYRVFGYNNGPSTAVGVTVLVTLPQQTTIFGDPVVNYLEDTDSCTLIADNMPGDVLSCDLGDLERYRSYEFLIKTRVDPSAVADQADGTIVIEAAAQIFAATLDTNLENNIDDADCFVQDLSDLKVTKICKPDRSAGATFPGTETFLCTLYVDNLGPSTARQVSLRDEALSNGEFTLLDSTRLDPSRDDAGPFPRPGPESGETVEFDLIEPLEPQDTTNGGRWIVELFYNVPDGADVNNAVSVFTRGGGTPDQDNANNMAMESVHIDGVANLDIEQGQEEGEEDPEALSAPESATINGLTGILGVPDPVLAGQQVVSTFNTTNLGPSPAVNAFIEASLPPEVRVVDVAGIKPDGSAAGCVAGTPGNPLDPAVCQFGTLLLGETGTMIVTMLVLPDAVDDPVTDSKLIQVDARSGSDTFDSDLSNNYEFDPITVNAEADLRLVKFAVGSPVAGQAIHYELNISNFGPSVSRDVTLRDRMPDGIQFVNALVDLEGSVGNVPLACTVTTGSNFLLCPLGDIPPTNGVPVIVIVNVLIDANVPDGTVLSNDADVNLSDTPDPDPTNNSDDTDITVLSQANLVVEKTGERLDPVAGTRLSYNVKVTNTGPSDAFNVLVRDVLPNGFRYVKDSDTCTEVVPGTLECRPAGAAPGWILPASQSVQFEILVELDAGLTCGVIVENTACATADNAAQACGSARSSIECVADLRVRKFGKPDMMARADETITYTVIVDNLGPSNTAPVVVTDTAISNGSFTLLAIIPDLTRQYNASCDYRSIDPRTGNVVMQGNVGVGGAIAPVGPLPGHLELTCVNPGPMQVFGPNNNPLAGPGRWVIQYVLQANDAQSINNVASVSGPDPDPDYSNNESATEHDIKNVADLSVSKTDLGVVQGAGCPAANAPMPAIAGMVTAGKTISWTITVTNTGPSMAENVKILDRLPPWITVTDVQNPGGSCSSGAPNNPLDRLTCGLGKALAITSTATAVITVTALVDPSTPAGTVLENDVMVMADPFDDTNANNFDSTFTTVKTSADLRIEKMDMPDPVKAGEMLWYTLRVTNDGPSDALFVVLTDTLPAEVEFVSATTTKLSKVDGMCMAKGQVVNCALGTIPVGHFGDVLIKVNVKPDAVPSGLTQTTINNTAVVGSMTDDPCAANNTITEPTTVQRLSSVHVTKTDDPDPVLAGNVVTYTVTFGNSGPSTATNITVVDVLPAGLSYLRCTPVTPGNQVTCTQAPAGTITLNEIQSGGAVVWQDTPPSSPLNDLDPGESYSFQIVALVESGYVLDGRGDTGAGQACQALALATGYPHFAHNNVTITAAFFDMMAGAPAVQTNTHDECTRVNGAADLKIDKTDIFGDPAANPDNWFLQCDPVEPGGMITYMLTVSNMGPSDAAQVVVMDWLPEAFVAVDPAQIMIDIANGAGAIEEVRDTGKITLVIGRDVDNNGAPVLGRLNAGNSVKVTIRVMVRQDALCGGIALNRALVTTRALVGPPAVTSPTPDFDLTNNQTSEETTIECPSVTVNKTVSYDGTCPGVNYDAVNEIGPGATFCFEITNTGTTYLDEIRITDTLRARTNGMPIIVFTDTIRHGRDPKIPVAPGETVLRKHLLGALNKECGQVTNEVIATANPVNSGRTDLPCLDLVMASDDALIEVPCAGVDFRLQLPTLDTEECESWVQVQNVGDKDTMVLMVVWGDAGFCPPQAAGPLKAECSGLLRPGSAWSFAASQIPTGSKSAVLYSLSTERVPTPDGGRLPFGRMVCEEFFFSAVGDDFGWAEFDSAYRARLSWRGLDLAKYHGEPIAASVNRACPDPDDPNLTINAAYTGVSSDLEGARDPRSGSFAFFAPLLFAGQNGMNSSIHIQNSGTECTSLELWLKAQDNCMRPTLADVLSLAPGETVTFDPNTVVGPGWLGSGWIRSTQPLGLVIDTKAGNHFSSYNGFAADITDYGFSIGNMISYIPLTYSEYQGWDTAIQVQNLSAVTAAKVKVYFLDRSGDIITTLVDWVCPYGSQTFFLPVLASIPGNWVGSARVESQEWWAPGSPLVEPPRIAAVALMEKWADPARTVRREAVAYNGQPECLLYDWQIADGTKGGLSSGSAVFAIPLVAKGNRGITSEIGITNLVPKPGFTDFAMYFYDQNGLLDYVCQKLNEKQVEYINLDTWGFVHDGFLGSMVVSAVFWEHDVFDNQGRFQRNLVGLGGVAVERIGGVLGDEDVPGDESKAFEAFPVFNHFAPEEVPNCPGVPGGFRP